MVNAATMKNVLVVLLGTGTLAACAGVADLDVKYKATQDGGLSPASTPDAAMVNVEAPPPATPVQTVLPPVAVGSDGDAGILQPENSPCPCDEAQGFGCCITNGTATCISREAACGTGKGALFFRCIGPDMEGSVCCLHRFETMTESALAASCGRPGESIVCTVDADCPNGGKCTTTTCGGTKIGTCDGTPVCP